MGLGGLLALASIPFKNSFALPEGAGVNECTVKDPSGGVSGRVSVTLRQALNYANRADSRYQYCRKKITIDTETIHLAEPIHIGVVNAQQSEPFVLKGDIGTARVILNFSGMSPRTEGDMAEKCAVVFENPESPESFVHHVTVKNISIENVPSGYSGICFKGTTNNIILDNVRVAQVSRGHGIVVSQSANEITIKSNSELDEIYGNGIHILNLNPLAHIELEATSRDFAPEGQTTGEGVANFVEASNATDFVMRQIGLGSTPETPYKFVNSAADAKVLLSEISEVEDGKFLIRGAVVKGSETCAPFVPEAEESFRSQLVEELARLQVYAVGSQQAGAAPVTTGEGSTEPQSVSTSGGQCAVFLTYVTKQSDCAIEDNPNTAELEGCNNGILESSISVPNVVEDFGGIFNFVLDTNEFIGRIRAANAEGVCQVTSLDKIVIVPELSTLTLATSTDPKGLVGGTSQTDVCEGDTTGSGSSGDGTIPPNYGWKRVSDCLAARSGGRFPHPRIALWDSDGDTIPDYQEDLDGQCDCDDNEFSCWDRPDSEYDGITDNRELLGGTLSATAGSGKFCSDTGLKIPGAPTSALAPADICDVDGDNTSNAQDIDSDNDVCLKDYEEDRDRVFGPARKAHYYVWDPVGGTSIYSDEDGDPVDCTSVLTTSPNPDAGAFFGIFRIKEDGTIVKHTYATLPQPGDQLMKLACINDSVTEGNNFNGRWDDARGETMAYYNNTYGDSLNDCECRGGRASTGTDPKIGQIGACVLNCVPGEFFESLPDAYVVVDEDGIRQNTYKLNAATGAPLLFEKTCAEIEQLCTSDIDRDGIPDCVESDDGVCNDLSGRNLKWYKKDSDDDGKVDGPSRAVVAVAGGEATSVEVDLCPLTNDDQISCQPRNAYLNRPVLSCFLDRDSDGLRDAQEDLNKDGDPDTMAGLDGRATTETDTLSADTDGDGIGDYIEVNSWGRYTNPADRDTDFDGLPDSLEVENYPDNVLEVEDLATESPNRPYSDRFNARCNSFTAVPTGTPDLVVYAEIPANRLGTDPAQGDTDLDGILDGTEVLGSISDEIPIEDLLTNFLEGFDVVTNPLSSDSDGDGLSDSAEYGTDGMVDNIDSNPCDNNTDDDSLLDGNPAERGGCAINPHDLCVPSATGQRDSDSDGLSDAAEIRLTTDPNDQDSDNDGLKDGEEDTSGDGQLQLQAGETDPRCEPRRADGTCVGLDTDQDGLTDGEERTLGTFANVGDTDADGIPDGVEVNFNPFSSFTGTDTNPTSPDTDSDGLCDGDNSQTNGGITGSVTCIRGEDINRNGRVDTDPINPNQYIETDPRIADTDNDGIDDRTEVCSGGRCDLVANIGRATQGASSGCFSVSASAPFAASSMLYVYGLLLMLNRVLKRRLKRKSSTEY